VGCVYFLNAFLYRLVAFYCLPGSMPRRGPLSALGNLPDDPLQSNRRDWMIGLLQRVSEARVEVGSATIGRIAGGLVVLIGVERGDTTLAADRLLERLLTYRVFADAEGRMNLSLLDTAGGLLLVPQFTLAAETQKGTRPGFSTAADPTEGRRLFEYLVEGARKRLAIVQTGEFGAHMRVSLTNDGPVTFWLRVAPAGSS
jgi:D-tyrosyl-tRNA(Tyr) deacylase